MKNSAGVSWALIATVATLTGCGSDHPAASADPPTTTRSTTTATPSPTRQTTASSVTTPPSTGFGENITVTDTEGYQWQVTWSFSPPAARSDISQDPPGQASAVWDTSSATVNITFATPGRSEPNFNRLGLQNGLEMGALYPAGGPVCSHLVAAGQFTGGGKGSTTVTSPTGGEFCYSPLNTGYARYPSGTLALIQLPEAEAPAVASALGEPSFVVLVGTNSNFTSSAADSCTIVMDDPYQTRKIVVSSTPGPLTCTS